MGYLFEMAAAGKKSLKHYGDAYSLLTQNKIPKEEIDEFKTVCDVVNFKVRLHLSSSSSLSYPLSCV
jgi:hypothetical protein